LIKTFLLTRRGTLAAAALTLAGVAVPMAVSLPASAASTCGSTKTVPVNIHYTSCAGSGSAGTMTARDTIQNAGTAAAIVRYQVGRSTNGGPVAWTATGSGGLGAHTTLNLVKSSTCTSGTNVRAALRVVATGGAWGPIAYSASIACA
jgi:hypothetical protein